MSIAIEITHNPYGRQTQILMDGSPVSSYSTLKKYMDQPFEEWCDRIFEAIHQECNHGKYRLFFCSREEEIQIMEQLAREDDCCEQFTSALPVQKETLPQRMASLSQVVRECGKGVIPVQRLYAAFSVPRSFGETIIQEIQELEIHNSYCRVETTVSKRREMVPGTDVYFRIDEGSEPDWRSQVDFPKGYYIQMGKETAFLGKKGQVFAYRASQEELFPVIFTCFLLDPLLKVFCSTLEQLPEEAKRTYRRELEAMTSIYPSVIPEMTSRVIELGTGNEIRFRSSVPGYSIDTRKLRYEYSTPGIISCNGVQVSGLKEGKTTMWIYRKGENNPCASLECQVIRRNRISQLDLEEDEIVLGEGDSYQTVLSYYPPDADNVSSIKWRSDDSQVAQVNDRGVVTGREAGKCTISCIAERVRISCPCVVKPYLKQIHVETREICLPYGASVPFSYSLEPDFCIDPEITVFSQNVRIANAVGGIIRGTGVGETKILLQNSSKTVQEEIRVTVLDEKGWKKYQRKKKSFWERLRL